MTAILEVSPYDIFSIEGDKLKFREKFNFKIQKLTIDEPIKIIDFGWSYFNQSIDNIIFPDTLHTIIFGACFNQNIDNAKFPITLHTIDLSNCNTQFILAVHIPLQVKEVIISKYDRKLEKELIKLPYGCILKCV